MLKKTATFFSYLFHPLLMPTTGIVILMFAGTFIDYMPLQARKMLIVLAAIGTFALPALMIPVFILRGSISSVAMGERRERHFSAFRHFCFLSSHFFSFSAHPGLPFHTCFHAGFADIRHTGAHYYRALEDQHPSYRPWRNGGAHHVYFFLHGDQHGGLPGSHSPCRGNHGRIDECISKHTVPHRYMPGFLAGFATVLATMMIY